MKHRRGRRGSASRPPLPDPCEAWKDSMDTANDRIAAAPLPTTRTLRRRRSIPLQMWRFGTINLRMLRMVRKAH